MTLDHIAIIVSSEEGVNFYKFLGFEEVSREARPKDQIVFLTGNGCTLEIFIDPTHPKRVSDPEANGLRHISFYVEDLEKMRAYMAPYNPEPIKPKYNIFFVKDPDGQPIEFRQMK